MVPDAPNAQARRLLSAPRRGVVGFFRGVGFVFRGAKLVYLEQPGLARYWAVPIVVTSLVLLVSFGLVGHLHDGLVSSIWGAPTGDDWLAGLARAAHWVFDVLAWLVLGALALVTTVLVGSIVAAPFNARLGEVLDERVTGHAPPPFAITRVLADVLRTVIIEVLFFALNVVLFVASIAVPAIAPALGVVGLVLGAYYFAVGYLEIPQVARDRTLADRLRFLGAHPMAILGYGTGVGLFLFIPIVNLLFMPAAVAGAVLLHAEASAPTP
jgi:CysZ protein